MRRFFILCWLGVLITSCGSESFTEVETVRAPLIGGFESYVSREEVMAKLPSSMQVKVVNDSSLAKTDSQPPYKLHTISLAPFEHLKHTGRLHLTFYNNRLEQCMFYPDQLDSYLRSLEQTGVELGLGREEVRGNTVIWAGTDEDQNKYVGWADKRLRDQQRRWLARYD